MPKRCVIYLRVSTVEQAAPGHHSLEAQEILCRRYAETNGYYVVEVLRDEGYSGRTTNRPGLQRLDLYTSNRPPVAIQAILVQDTSRMGRDTTEYLLFRRQLRDRGIELIAVTQPNIDSSPEGTLVDTILAGINQYQSEEKGRRVAIAMRKKFEEGCWPGMAPLGYLNVDHEGKKRIEPDPERFPLVQQAFALYATGRYTQEQLCDHLAKKGLRDRSGRPVSRTTFNHILANPFYYGQMQWRDREKMGRHVPATDRETWQKCQRITAERNHYTPRMRKHAFLLAGLVRCAECGKPKTHTVVARKNKRYYHCNSRANCSQPYVPEGVLHEEVERLIARIKLTPAFIVATVAKARLIHDRQRGRSSQQKSVLLRRKTALEGQRDAAEEKLLAGVISDDAFRRQMQRIMSDLDETQRSLDELENSRRLDTEGLRQILQFIREIPQAYRQAPPKLKQQYLRLFFEEFVVRNKRIERTTPTPLFQWLREVKRVRTNANWLPSLELIRTTIAALESHAWISTQTRLLSREPRELAATA